MVLAIGAPTPPGTVPSILAYVSASLLHSSKVPPQWYGELGLGSFPIASVQRPLPYESGLERYVHRANYALTAIIDIPT